MISRLLGELCLVVLVVLLDFFLRDLLFLGQILCGNLYIAYLD